MNSDNIHKLLDYGSTYRVQELADMLVELDDAAAYSLADSLCAIMISVKSTMPPHVWNTMCQNLLKFHFNSQFQLIREEEDENDG